MGRQEERAGPAQECRCSSCLLMGCPAGEPQLYWDVSLRTGLFPSPPTGPTCCLGSSRGSQHQRIFLRQLWGCTSLREVLIGGSALGSAWTKKSSVSSPASDRRGSRFLAPSPHCLSSRFSFFASLSPFCCGFLLSWEPQDHGSAGGMCCSAQLLGADRVGGGVVCCFFFAKEKYKNLFLCESVKFLPVAVVLGPPSLLFFSFFVSFTLAWVSFLLGVLREVEMSCPFCREQLLSLDHHLSSSSSIPQGQSTARLPSQEAAAGRAFAVAQV